jgi:hypothetical protein
LAESRGLGTADLRQVISIDPHAPSVRPRRKGDPDRTAEQYLEPTVHTVDIVHRDPDGDSPGVSERAQTGAFDATYPLSPDHV